MLSLPEINFRAFLGLPELRFRSIFGVKIGLKIGRNFGSLRFTSVRRITFGGSLLAAHFWRITFGGSLLADHFWRNTFSGSLLAPQGLFFAILGLPGLKFEGFRAIFPTV